MDFGKVDDIEKVDFTLPADKAETEKILKHAKASKTQVFVGCAKWGRKDWIDKIYPKGAKEANFLDHYVQQFNSIELNATHYKMPELAGIQKWAEKAAGKDFKFCPKFPQVISHILRLKNAGEATTKFIKALEGFGSQLGESFLQLPPNFPPKNFDDLENYLKSLPTDFRVCVELRHPQWFEGDTFKKTFDMLEKHKIGSVITDAAGRRDCVHMRLTNSMAFIRFVGNSLHKSDYTRIDDWVDRIRIWMDKGIETIYFFMHQHDELYTPEAIIYTIEQLNKKCGLSLHKPRLIKEELFD